MSSPSYLLYFCITIPPLVAFVAKGDIRLITVAFDLDDTLYDRSQPLNKAFIEFIGNRNLSFPSFKKTFQFHSDIAFEHVKNGVWTLKESHIHRITNTLKPFNIDISEEEAQSFQQLYEKNQQHIEAYPNVTKMLDDLQKNGIQTLIITNGPINHQRRKLKNLGLDTYFKPEQIIVSGEEGVAKPDERLFLLVEERFHINKSKTWYVGDSYANDILGAKKVGWNTVWFNVHEEIIENNIATKTVYSTLEMEQILVDLID